MHLDVCHRYEALTVHTIAGDITVRDVMCLDRITEANGDHQYVIGVRSLAVKASDIIRVTGPAVAL